MNSEEFVEHMREIVITSDKPWTQVFDADSIAVVARRDIASCLRMLADAVDFGDIDAALISCEGNGFVQRDWRDTRAHLTFKMDLAAEIRRAIEVPNPKTVGTSTT